MLRRLCALALLWPLLIGPALAQDAAETPLQDVLQNVQEDVANPSRSTVPDVLRALLAADAPGTVDFLRLWSDRAVYERPGDGLFFYATPAGGDLTLIDIDSGAELAIVGTREVNQIRPNAGVRREIGAALVAFELMHPDPARRIAALDAAARSPDADQIAAIRAARATEDDAAIAARMDRLIALLVARFDPDSAARIAAIDALRGDVSTPARSVLNQLLQSRADVAPSLPADVNVALVKTPGQDITLAAAYDALVAAGLAPAAPGRNAIRDALRVNVVDGAVGGVPVHQLDTDANRIIAYQALQDAGTVPPLVTQADMQAAVAQYVFFDAYLEPDPAVTSAAATAQAATTTKVALFQFLSLGFDALSLASIFFLAAIGLAITFGVMRVINMAHGEFIMMGAYTGYVVQTVIPNYTTSLVVALPLAFAVTFLAGVVMERLVIRHLYTRPLETLLATFGISIALQQLAKNIFGTQARPLTAPDWLAGAIQINDLVSVAAVRVAIVVMAALFLLLLLYILNRTRLGLEVRAVTQNPGMAASMGINPDRINMLTFGLGSGIAGVAGVAIGLVAQVTSEMGANYIVQSFMTVVVGGVGSVFGTLAGAALIGSLQKGIEWFNPANTLAAQTYMVLFIILFIQFRPKGIVALKGRAAGD
ncbi:urea ABC transporter permease subunit UrtB [Yoonia vestfoldensis]|jgi:urea transport system permease protein|uniref:High-affinity branched-chain amino acid transport system permease protein LivH n=1 Tax=Yoonia vestfoldensis TaxID=245188 RepID=A0A1Y0E7X9_9RHOB|nr:urea ABC transporter permease subunit UrtB [Yoonia vestfoldensis]ART99704.1 high-affinity branched-chain amino acid transport system permease protein LivH [Yoonia vestfoldensis]